MLEGMKASQSNGQNIEDAPPFLGRWSRVYAAVLCYLLVLIAALYALTRAFSY
jgi:hypothetical protein